MRLMNKFFKRKIFNLAGLMMIGALMLGGCSSINPYTGEQQISDTTLGAGLGAVGGGVAGMLLGNREGAIIGTALGGAAGAGLGHHFDNENAELRQRLVGTGVQVRKIDNRIDLIMASDVTFETNQSAIRSGFYPVLNSVATVLKKYNKTSVTVSGYTDNTGTASHNQILSEQRAQSVADYLAAQEIDPNRIFARGFGERHPMASNASTAGRAQNRRVEITLRSME